MRCESAQLELSARADGGDDRALRDRVSAHVAGCDVCRAFDGGVRSLRTGVRLEPAGVVPDGLASRILARVQHDPRPLAHPWRRPVIAFAAAAAAAALLLGGLPLRRGLQPALATEIAHHVAEASRTVTSYAATLDIVERNFRTQVPERRFTARVAFSAPERFRTQIADHTDYPSGAWPRNDITLHVDADRWAVSGPRACPRETIPGCAAAGREQRAGRGREPFAGDMPLPTDVVVPTRTLTDATGAFTVIGHREVAGRRAVTVELPARDAAALFGALHAAGVWRPFYPLDPVRVSLDERSWFPLAYEVRAGDGPLRAAWASRNGIGDVAGETVFAARARTFTTSEVAVPRIRGMGGRDAGFREGSVGGAVAPTELAGLRPYRAGVPSTRDETLLSYARGLTWLTIRQTRSWDEPALFGDVGPLATRVGVGDGVGYAEPATDRAGRRLAIHAHGVDLFLETNLPMRDLLTVAASLPVRGEPAPPAWLVRRWSDGIVREQVSLAHAVRRSPFVLLPRNLPSSYRVGAVHLVRAAGERGVTIYYRRTGTEPDGIGLRLHQSPGAEIPPPLDPDVFTVRVRGVAARFTPDRSRLEWLEDGVYRSLEGAGFDLAALAELARSLVRP